MVTPVGHPELGAPPAIVLCPAVTADTPGPDWVGHAHSVLSADGLAVVRPSAPPPAAAAVPPWVAGVAGSITVAAPAGPLLIVAFGPAVRLLPPLAVSLRARRRSIVGYVLVDADLGDPVASGADWPGAPVTYVRTPSGAELGWRLAGLHGWRRVQGEPIAGIRVAAGLLSQGTSGEG